MVFCTQKGEPFGNKMSQEIMLFHKILKFYETLKKCHTFKEKLSLLIKILKIWALWVTNYF